MSAPEWNDDFEDIVAALVAHDARFLIVGAHAMALHGVPRATGDLDILVEPTPANAQRVFAALASFGAPVAAPGVTMADFARAGTVYQMGLPPRRIYILTSISGLSFAEADATKAVREMPNELPFLGLEALIANKRASGRPKDLADLALLEARAGK